MEPVGLGISGFRRPHPSTALGGGWRVLFGALCEDNGVQGLATLPELGKQAQDTLRGHAGLVPVRTRRRSMELTMRAS